MASTTRPLDSSPPSSQPWPANDPRTLQFTLAITLILASWPALTTAVANSWGGPDSAGKRDWLAGVLSDLFASRPDTNQEELEELLLDVMYDEFDVVLEDQSETEVANDILRLRKACGCNEFEEIDKLRKRWEEKAKKGGDGGIKEGPKQDQEEEEWSGIEDEDDDDDDDDDEGGVPVDGDVDMAEAPALAPAKAKPQPEVDEEGFTKVIGRKKR